MSPAPSRWWQNLTTAQFAALDWTKLVTILPVAAVEQHGPHLPVGTDATINAGILARAVELMPADLAALVLPMQPVGKSNEHLSYLGTLSLSYDTLARVWTEIAESVHRAGGRRLLVFNSHGGQPQVMEIVLRELRVRLGMLAVGCSWGGITATDDLFPPPERRHGLHGGEIETSLMLHLQKERVHMEKAENFVPLSVALEARGCLLTPEGAAGFGWSAQDLHPAGVCGNAAAADAARGGELVERAARALVRLTAEVADFPLAHLTAKTAFNGG